MRLSNALRALYRGYFYQPYYSDARAAQLFGTLLTFFWIWEAITGQASDAVAYAMFVLTITSVAT